MYLTVKALHYCIKIIVLPNIKITKLFYLSYFLHNNKINK